MPTQKTRSLRIVVVLDPPQSLPPPTEYYEKVKAVHTVGGYGSIGYRAPWQEEESRKLLLRTHTTASSANLLWRLANRKGGFKPVKMFSIDRVFRNEATDATHLAEFHQVEGVVADRDLTLADLIGMLVHFLSWKIVIETTAARFYESLLQKDGHRKFTLQACI